MDCIFCKIINNEIPSYTIYEDNNVKVIMDINPVSNGHLLVIPKKHITDINEINDTILNINNVSKDMYKLLKDKLNIDGLTLLQNNGYGQDVKHYHMHLIPRYNGDSLFRKNNVDKVEDIYNKLK